MVPMGVIKRISSIRRQDMKLNAAVGKGEADVLSSGSLPAIQKMKSICAPRGSGNGTLARMKVGIGGEERSLITCQLLGAEGAWDAFPGVNEREVSRVEMQLHGLEKDLDPENKETGS